MSEDAASRAEDLWLSAESLERMLTAQRPQDGQALFLVDAVFIAARNLHNYLAAATPTPAEEER